MKAFRIRPLALCASLPLVAAALSACASKGPPSDLSNEPPRSEVGSRAGRYALAQDADSLQRLVAEDLEARDPRRAYEGLNEFTGQNISRKTTARAHLIWQQVEPVTMFQFSGGRSHMTAVKKLEGMLANASEEEIRSAMESLRGGDFERVRELREDPMGVFHPETAALSAEIGPYASLAGGVLRYRELAASQDPSEEEVQEVLTILEVAQSELAALGDGEATFLADAAAAQSLERAGQLDAAAEYWMRIADSPQFANQPETMRNLVAARIKTHSVRLKERLILEVEEERREEIRSLSDSYETRVAGLEVEHSEFEGWARDGLRTTAAALATLGEDDARQRARIDAVAAESKLRDERIDDATEALTRELNALGVRTDDLASAAGEQAEALGRLEGLSEEHKAALAELARMTDAQREKIEGLAAMTADQRKEIYALNQATEEESETLESMAQAIAAQAAALGDLDRTTDALEGEVGRVAGELEVAKESGAQSAEVSRRNEADLRRALRDLQAYRASVDELTANASLEALDALGAEEVPPPSQSSERAAGDPAPESSGEPTPAAATMPARLSLDAMPDLFAFLEGAQESVGGAARRMTSFITAH